MLKRQCSTERSLTRKRQFFEQDFYIHHPLLDKIIESKLQRCLKYGQVREFVLGTKTIERKRNVQVIEAPIITGSAKKIELKLRKSGKSSIGYETGFERPKTTNTVIRSRTSQPRIRQKLEHLMREDEHFEETLKPTFSLKRFSESKI